MLFVGNSYTSRNQLPQRIAELGGSSSRGTRIQTNSIVAGGASLKRHWNAGHAQRALAEARFDYVVLQEQSTLPVKSPQRYHDNVRLFSALIAAHGSVPVLYLTWSRANAPQTQQLLDDAVDSIAVEIGARVVPVGPAWHAVMRAEPAIALYEDDGSHPTPAGSYLAACTFVACLFGTLADDDVVAVRMKIPGDIAARLRAVAVRSCAER